MLPIPLVFATNSEQGVQEMEEKKWLSKTFSNLILPFGRGAKIVQGWKVQWFDKLCFCMIQSPW